MGQQCKFSEMNYTKPALTFVQQVAQLESRGLKINDHARAIRHLSNISYYRLSAYMLPFREVAPASRQVLENFREGTNWDDIINSNQQLNSCDL